jgi:pimeloyl-ACP methyl ester carboxylesterase
VLQLAAAGLVVLLGAIAILVVVAKRSWPAVQLQAVAVLATTEATPVLAWGVRAVTAEPRIQETRVAKAPSTLVRPGRGDGPWPAVVFVNGATREGRHHPKVQRLARGLARAGFLVVVPDLPGLALGKITLATVAATIDVAKATSEWSNVRDARVGFYGVSVGASLALLAAESPALADRVTIVGGEAPWVDMRRVIRLATTGYYDGARYETDPYASLAIGRSLAAGCRETARGAGCSHGLRPSTTMIPARSRSSAARTAAAPAGSWRCSRTATPAVSKVSICGCRLKSARLSLPSRPSATRAGSTCPSSSRLRRTTSTSRPPSHAGSRPSRQTCA